MNKHEINYIAILCAVLILVSSAVTANDKAGEEINWQVISSGGNMNGTSTNYGLSGTVAQSAVGAGASTNYGLSHGFWHDFGGGGGCCEERGDIDHSGDMDIADLVYLVNYMFQGGPAPVCDTEADVDGSTGLDIADLVYMVNYMFQGGPAPVACP